MYRVQMFVFKQCVISFVVLSMLPWISTIHVRDSSDEEDLDTQVAMSIVNDAKDVKGAGMMDNFEKCVNRCIPDMQKDHQDDSFVTLQFKCHRWCMTNHNGLDGNSNEDDGSHGHDHDQTGATGNPGDDDGKGLIHGKAGIPDPEFG